MLELVPSTFTVAFLVFVVCETVTLAGRLRTVNKRRWLGGGRTATGLPRDFHPSWLLV